jgi:cleavage and polyadenylation specificity factor subunit 2
MVIKILKNLEKGSEIFIIPSIAGNSIGSAIWKIQKDTDEIIYAVDYNHKKERHLDGTKLLSYK